MKVLQALRGGATDPGAWCSQHALCLKRTEASERPQCVISGAVDLALQRCWQFGLQTVWPADRRTCCTNRSISRQRTLHGRPSASSNRTLSLQGPAVGAQKRPTVRSCACCSPPQLHENWVCKGCLPENKDSPRPSGAATEVAVRQNELPQLPHAVACHASRPLVTGAGASSCADCRAFAARAALIKQLWF